MRSRLLLGVLWLLALPPAEALARGGSGTHSFRAPSGRGFGGRGFGGHHFFFFGGGGGGGFLLTVLIVVAVLILVSRSRRSRR
jgi:uncharacterized membrane protein